ncbi:MAG: OmpA family protein [Pyrinomonadaceae bacterium]|nr:OmpA family protein [Pyrinomonadaceae bacterium]
MRSSRLKLRRAESGHTDRWMISYADLMTLLLALFIVMYAASDHERARKIAAAFGGENTAGSGILPGSEAFKTDDRDAFARKLTENPVLMQKTKMRQTERGLIISLSEAGFFAAGEASVNADAESAISALAESLKETALPVRVEGHTDSTPISNSRYPSNWELSTARAASVLVRLAESGIAPERLSAAGYGGFQPVVDNATAANRAQNRRVDVVLLNR